MDIPPIAYLIMIQKGVFVVRVSVAMSIIGVVFTNKFYENLTGVLKYSPIIQIGEIASGMITTAYFVSTVLSLTFLIVCALTSAIKFNQTEL